MIAPSNEDTTRVLKIFKNDTTHSCFKMWGCFLKLHQLHEHLKEYTVTTTTKTRVAVEFLKKIMPIFSTTDEDGHLLRLAAYKQSSIRPSLKAIQQDQYMTAFEDYLWEGKSISPYIHSLLFDVNGYPLKRVVVSYPNPEIVNCLYCYSLRYVCVCVCVPSIIRCQTG